MKGERWLEEQQRFELPYKDDSWIWDSVHGIREYWEYLGRQADTAIKIQVESGDQTLRRTEE